MVPHPNASRDGIQCRAAGCRRIGAAADARHPRGGRAAAAHPLGWGHVESPPPHDPSAARPDRGGRRRDARHRHAQRLRAAVRRAAQGARGVVRELRDGRGGVGRGRDPRLDPRRRHLAAQLRDPRRDPVGDRIHERRRAGRLRRGPPARAAVRHHRLGARGGRRACGRRSRRGGAELRRLRGGRLRRGMGRLVRGDGCGADARPIAVSGGPTSASCRSRARRRALRPRSPRRSRAARRYRTGRAAPRRAVRRRRSPR